RGHHEPDVLVFGEHDELPELVVAEFYGLVDGAALCCREGDVVEVAPNPVGTRWIGGTQFAFHLLDFGAAGHIDVWALCHVTGASLGTPNICTSMMCSAGTTKLCLCCSSQTTTVGGPGRMAMTVDHVGARGLPTSAVRTLSVSGLRKVMREGRWS